VVVASKVVVIIGVHLGQERGDSRLDIRFKEEVAPAISGKVAVHIDL
jgi:hypothetical protein